MRGNNVSLFTIVILQFEIYEAINVFSTIKGSNLKKKENNMVDLQYGIFFRLFFNKYQIVSIWDFEKSLRFDS